MLRLTTLLVIIMASLSLAHENPHAEEEPFLGLKELKPEKIPFQYQSPETLNWQKRENGNRFLERRLVQEKKLGQQQPDGSHLSYHHLVRVYPNVLMLDLEESVRRVSCLPADDAVLVSGDDLAFMKSWLPGTKLAFRASEGCPPDSPDSDLLFRQVIHNDEPVPASDAPGLYSVRFLTEVISFGDVFQEVKLNVQYLPPSDGQTHSESDLEKRGVNFKFSKSYHGNYNPETNKAEVSFPLLQFGGSTLECTNCFLNLRTDFIYNVEYSFGSIDKFLLKVGGRSTISIGTVLNLAEGKASEAVEDLFKQRILRILFQVTLIDWKADLYGEIYHKTDLDISSAGTASLNLVLDNSAYVGIRYQPYKGFTAFREGPSLDVSFSRTLEDGFQATGYARFGIGPKFSLLFHSSLASFPASFVILPYFQVNLGAQDECSYGYNSEAGLEVDFLMEPFSIFGFTATLGGRLPYDYHWDAIEPQPIVCSVCSGCIQGAQSLEEPKEEPTPFVSSSSASPVLLSPGAKTEAINIGQGEVHYFYLYTYDLVNLESVRITLQTEEGNADLAASSGTWSETSSQEGTQPDIIEVSEGMENLDIYFIDFSVEGTEASTYTLHLDSTLKHGYWHLVYASNITDLVFSLSDMSLEDEYLVTFEGDHGHVTIYTQLSGTELPSYSLLEQEYKGFVVTPALYCSSEPCKPHVTIPKAEDPGRIWIIAGSLQTISKGSATTLEAQDQGRFYFFYLPFFTDSEFQRLLAFVLGWEEGMDLDFFVSTKLYVPNAEFHDFAAYSVGNDFLYIPVNTSEFVFAIYLYNNVTGNFTFYVETVDELLYGTDSSIFSVSGAESSNIYLHESEPSSQTVFSLQAPEEMTIYLPAAPSYIEGYSFPEGENTTLHLNNQQVKIAFSSETLASGGGLLTYTREQNFSCASCSLYLTDLLSLTSLPSGPEAAHNGTVRQGETLHLVSPNNVWKEFTVTLDVLWGQLDLYISPGDTLPSPLVADRSSVELEGPANQVVFTTDRDCNVAVHGRREGGFALSVRSVEIPPPTDAPSESGPTSPSAASASPVFSFLLLLCCLAFLLFVHP